MAREILVDTSAWVALFSSDDQHHEAAAAAFSSLRSEAWRFVTTAYVFDETVTRVRKIGGHRQAVAAGTAILDLIYSGLIDIDAEVHAEAWRLFRKLHDQPLSFTDCTSIAVMRRESFGAIFSFDDDFRRAGVTTVPQRRK